MALTIGGMNGNLTVELTGALDAAQAMSAIPSRILRAQEFALSEMRKRLGTEAKRDIGLEYNLRAGRIAKDLRTQNTPDGIKLIGKARGINAIEFGATWSRVRGGGLVARVSRLKYAAPRALRLRGNSGLGAKWAVRRGNAKKVHPGTFIARGKNGAMLVFQRDPAGGTYTPKTGWHAGQKQTAQLLGVWGARVDQMLRHGRRPERLVEFARNKVEEYLRKELGITP